MRIFNGSLTCTDLVAYRTELVVMLCVLGIVSNMASYLPVDTSWLQVATIFKATPSDLLPHLPILLQHAYEYPQVSATYIVVMSCRTHGTL